MIVPAAWSLAARVALPLLIVVLAVALVWGYGRRQYLQGLASGRAEVQARWDASIERANRSEREKEARWRQDQQEASNETQRIAARNRALQLEHVARAAAADDRVRDAAAARLATIPSGPDPAAARQCAAVAGEFAELFSASRAELRALGKAADTDLADARTRGLECERRYDALTTNR